MKAQTLTTFVALASGLQQVAATGWSDFKPFTPPQNSNDVCNPRQSGGFDWSDIVTGAIKDYNGFDFKGWNVDNLFNKRDALEGRTFGSKCIKGKATPDISACPKISAKDKKSFSIEHLDVSVDFDVELEFHYGMKDGSTCKQKSKCKKSGTKVKNTQCGGAHDVTIVYPKPQKDKPVCNIGIHTVKFHCPPKVSTTPVATATPETSKPVETTPVASTTPVTPPTSVPSTTAQSTTASTDVTVPPSSSVPTTKPSSSAPETTKPSSSAPETTKPSSSAPSSTPEVTKLSSTPVPSSSKPEVPSTTKPPVVIHTTVVVETTLTTCPVTSTYVTGGTTMTEVHQTVSTLTTTKTATSTVCGQCAETTRGVSPVTTSVAPPQPTSICPDVLPKCLNTWLTLDTNCASNADKSCYCPNSNFTTHLFECLAAHGADSDEVASAQSYFQGICAQYVPQNPAIITAAPETVTVHAPIIGPMSTIEVYTTVVVPCTETDGPAFTTMVYSTAVTVPQVIFTSLTSGTGVGLAPGTQKPITATPTPGVQTTFASLTPTRTAVAVNSTTTGPARFTGAASANNVMSFGAAGAALAVAILAL